MGEEHYFKISQTRLAEILGLLGELPHKMVEVPIVLLQNLEVIDESNTCEKTETIESLIEG